MLLPDVVELARLFLVCQLQMPPVKGYFQGWKELRGIYAIQQPTIAATTVW